MSDIRIEAFSGDYSNDNAYENVLGYISQKTYIGGFGFTCNPDISIIRQFQLSEENSLYASSNPRKMWHLIITFSTSWNHLPLLQLAIAVANGFASDYQIMFGLDTDQGRPHLHFGVNAFSYHPDHSVLSETKMHNYLIQLQEYLKKCYPNMTVTLQFLGKGEQNV